MADEQTVDMEINFRGKKHPFIPPKLSDLVAFEKQFGVKATELDSKPVYDDNGHPLFDAEGEPLKESNVAVEWMCFLMYRSLARSGAIDKKKVPFNEDFIDEIDEIEVNNLPADVTGESASEEVLAEDPTETGA